MIYTIMERYKEIQDVPVIIADQQGVIIYVNKKFEEVFQWRQVDAVGKLITIIIPPNLHDAHNLGFSRFIITHESKILNTKLNLKARKKNKEIIDAEHFIEAEKINDKWIFAATLRPIEV